MQNTVLRNDVGPCPGEGIVIGADNIFLNLNGHQILGNSDHGAAGEFAGIRLPGRTGVRVIGHPGGQRSGQMGTVAGFEAGVVIGGGSANTVENLIVRDNIGLDDPFDAELGDGIVLFESASNMIVDNVISNNGIFDGVGVLGGDADNNTIQGNIVEGTVGPSDGGPAGQGVIVNGAGLEDFNLGVITDTRILDNVIRRNGSAGSANINNVDAEIVGNTIEGNGLTNIAGNGIGVQAGFGFGGGRPTRVLVQDNEVHGNAANGILIVDGAFENRILDNDAANNNARGLRFPDVADLRDGNYNPDYSTADEQERAFDCDANVWQGNTWGSGFYFPDCVSVGGSGPPPPPPEPEGPFSDPSCSDGVDNDQDGFRDFFDLDCRDEGPPGSRSCFDGLDNDQDGLIDDEDPGCQGRRR